MATLHIVFKDSKHGIDVKIKESAALKKLAKQKAPKLTPAQRLALDTFHALAVANTFIPQISAEPSSSCCNAGGCDCK